MKKPDILDKINFYNYELIDANYSFKNFPLPDKDGYSTIKTGIEDSFNIDKEKKIFSLNSIFSHTTIQGNPKNKKEDDNTIITISLKIKLLYSYSDKEIDVKKLENIRWFFNTQANVISTLVAKDYILKAPFPLNLSLVDFQTKL